MNNTTEKKTATHKKICDQLNAVYVAKNHDYGDSFSRTYQRLGVVSCVTRLSDKMERLMTLCKSDAKVADEKMEDTLMDMANYAIMTIMELKSESEG